MKIFQTVGFGALLLVTGAIGAADKHGHRVGEASTAHYEYARVLDAAPIYREVRLSEPVRECWEQPVYRVRQQPKSAGGMLVGGLLGGVVGHQFGKGRGNQVATAMGTLIGAKVGHDAVNGHLQSESTLVGYEEHCKTRHRVRYEERLDGYDVSYEYRGQEYRLVMPYHPGEQIKIRVEFAPVI